MARAEAERPDLIDRNIDSIAEIRRRELEQSTPAQRRVERVARFIGRPLYLWGLLAFSVLWVALSLALTQAGRASFDPFPFPLLAGILALASLVSTTLVLIAQNRQAKLDQQHAHLDLQVNLLTEQKVTKIIHLLEELRRDMPMVRDRQDPQVAALQEAANAMQVVNAINKGGLLEEEVKAPAAGPGAAG